MVDAIWWATHQEHSRVGSGLTNDFLRNWEQITWSHFHKNLVVFFFFHENLFVKTAPSLNRDYLTTKQHHLSPDLLQEIEYWPILFWNVPKLLACPFAANQWLPNSPKDQLGGLFLLANFLPYGTLDKDSVHVSCFFSKKLTLLSNSFYR